MAEYKITLALSKSQRAKATKLIAIDVNLSAELQKTIERLAAKHGIK